MQFNVTSMNSDAKSPSTATDEIVEAASDEIAPQGEDVMDPPPSPEDSQQSDSTVGGAANQKAA